MTYTIEEIANALGCEARGDLSLTIRRAAEPGAAGPGDLALAMSPKYAEALGRGQARAALVWPDADWQAMGLQAAILAPRPRMAMSGLTRMLDPGQGFGEGIHPSAVIDPGAELGDVAQLRPGLGKQAPVDAVGHGRHENVGTLHGINHLRIGKRDVGFVEFRVEKLLQPDLDGIRQAPRDDDLQPLCGHERFLSCFCA